MLGNQENVPPEGRGGGRNIPVVPEYTEEQLTIIKAAMLEELGIGRKDTLPLEDGAKRGQLRDSHPTAKVATTQMVRHPVNPGVAAWQNFQPDDVNEADLQLDSIADGRLARLRRGNASGMTGGRGGRGRGDGAAQGGHNLTVDTGHHIGGRRGSGAIENSVGRSNFSMNSRPTPQTYFNDQRMYTPLMADMAVRYPAKLDATIALLRSTPENQTPGPQIPIPRAIRAEISGHQTSSINLPANTQSRWGNCGLDPNAFLKFVGLSKVGLQPSQPNAPIKTGVTSPTEPSPLPFQQSQASEPMVSIFSPMVTEMGSPAVLITTSVEFPIADQVSGLQPHISIPVEIKQFEPEKNTTSDGIILPHLAVQMGNGLTSSIWAPAAMDPLANNQLVSSPPKMATSRPLEQMSRGQVFRVHLVKVQRGYDNSRPGKARLLKDFRLDQDFTLELLQDETVVVREIVEKESVFLHKAGESTITYRAANKENTDPPTWTIHFQVPYQAKKFNEVVFLNRQGYPTSRPTARGLVTNTVVPARELPLANSDDTSPAVPSSILNNAGASILPSGSSELKKGLIGLAANFAAGISDSLPTQTENFASEATPRGDLPLQHAFNFENLMQKEAIDLEQFGPSPSERRDNPGFGNHIDIQTLDDISQVAGVTPLICLVGEEEPDLQPGEATSAVHDLNLLFDETMSRSTFNYLNNSPHGTLLTQLSRLAVKKGGSAAQGLTGPEILTSELYATVVYDLVGSFLSGSETFSKMPDGESIKLMKQQTLKVLELAVAHREGLIITIPTTMEFAESCRIETETSEHELPVKFIHCEPYTSLNAWDVAVENGVDSKATVTAKEAEDRVRPIPFTVSRLTYTVKDLKRLRKNAAQFRGNILPDDVLHLVRPKLPTSNSSDTNLTLFASAISVQLPSQGVNNEPSALVPDTSQALITTELINIPASNTQTQQTDMDLWHSMLSTLNRVKPVVASPLEISQSLVSQSHKEATATNDAPLAMKKPVASPSVSHSKSSFEQPFDIENLAKTLEEFHFTHMVAETPVVTPGGKADVPNGDTPKARLMKDNIFAKLSSSTLSSPPYISVSTSGLDVASVAAPSLLVANARLQAIGAHLSKSAALPVEVAVLQVELQNTKISNDNPAANLKDSTPPFNTVAPVNQTSQEPVRANINQHSLLEQVPAPAVAPSGTMYENIQIATNTNLRGLPGLETSRWSSAPSVPVPNAAPKATTQQHAPPMDPFAPLNTGFLHHGGLKDNPNTPVGLPSNPPMLPRISGVAPVYQTIVVQESDGSYREVTGMVKAGSIPIVAHMPVPVANYTSGLTPNFPARSDMYSRHMSNDSDSSDWHFKPDVTPFRHSPRDHHEVNAATSSRTALSPVRQGENVQAKLQSRLDNSLAHRGQFPPPL